ncbi:hypothetical protein ACTJJ0_12360 [Chitinophaga sp. 22321]|uniref:Conjugal transfer protein TraD n=1 Tax=Chitinophaga hostae TaxID=2831022 RepID=A0ABS5IWC3_9BACT|nr:conjugal transfer protein TraD [Chitinophaga hostae]MBS0027251.1 conjugal transfer protein TraD [Chitinophaga hostae]
MELLILLCLLIVIFLLVEEKMSAHRKATKKNTKNNPEVQLPDIMGQPKPIGSHMRPSTANISHNNEDQPKADNFDIEINKKENSIQIPQEELDEVFGDGPDLQKEEEEWSGYGLSGGDIGFTTGVTFDELSTVGMLLQQDVLEPSQQKTAVRLVQKIQGTELFSLLENSMEGASRKIAGLLDRSLSVGTDSSSSLMRNNSLDDFDIGEFV